jgi:hypothetical protein
MGRTEDRTPWAPPSWASEGARRRHTEGIDPRVLCGQNVGHPTPADPTVKLCGNAQQWLAAEQLWPSDIAWRETRNAKKAYRFACRLCGAVSQNLAYELAAELVAHPLRTLFAEDEAAAPVGIRCEVAGCTERGWEDQHWAPLEYFADADRWPRGALSSKCHHDWHERIGDGAYAGTDPLELVTDDGTACEHLDCAAAGIVRHRWAPLAAFGRASRRWPTSRLCEHHALTWQRTMAGQVYGGQAALDRARAKKAVRARLEVVA